jgi:hypothetical protein
MSNMIAQFGGRYLEWSDNVDAPLTHLMTEEQLKQYLLQKYGFRDGLQEIDARLDRVRKSGTSSQIGITREDLLRHNHAGEEGSTVSTEAEMVELYGEPEEPQASLDLDRPMELVDSYGFQGIHAPVLEVLNVVENCVLARVKLPQLENPVIVMFSAMDGEILSKNFPRDFEIRNVTPSND